MVRKPSRKRLHVALTGHYHALMAQFESSAAHKLPGAKGAIREDAVGTFLKAWVSNRFSVLTNVLAVAPDGTEAPSELDLVLHDSSEGSFWKLDAQGSNCVATYPHIKLVVEIKSLLTEAQLRKACTSMDKLTEFENSHGLSPLRVLFAYRVDANLLEDMREQFCTYGSTYYPFDAFIFLHDGAYLADRQDLQALRTGIPKGLGPEEVANDGPSADRMTLEYCMESKYANGFRLVHDGKVETNLLSFATLATFATAGAEATSALLSAAVHREFSPIFSEEEDEDERPDSAS